MAGIVQGESPIPMLRVLSIAFCAEAITASRSPPRVARAPPAFHMSTSPANTVALPLLRRGRRGNVIVGDDRLHGDPGIFSQLDGELHVDRVPGIVAKQARHAAAAVGGAEGVEECLRRRGGEHFPDSHGVHHVAADVADKRGLVPQPPPVTTPTLPFTGAAAYLITRGLSVRATMSRCARTKPLSMSSTTPFGSFRIRCTRPPAGYVSSELLVVFHDALDFLRRTAALELGRQPRVNDRLCQLGSDHPRAHRDDLRVVALARALGGIRVVARGCPYPVTLFAVIAMPMPVPHMRMPRSCFPLAIASATFTAMSG